jgi:hypothetical protein
VDRLTSRSRDQLGDGADAALAEGRDWDLRRALDRTLDDLAVR